MTELERSKEIIEYISNSTRKTPVKMYTDAEIKGEYSCQIFGDSLKLVIGDLDEVEKLIKENNIERDTRAREDENPLSMFDDDEVKNKPIYDLYMKAIGDVSPVIKDRLDDLVESYGKERVIVAINTTADNGGNSIKYVETVTAGNLKKEVNKDFGTTKRNSSNRGSSRKDEQVDWQAEYERVHGKK